MNVINIKLILVMLMFFVSSCKKEDYKFHYAFKPNVSQISHYANLWKNKVDKLPFADMLIENTEDCENAFFKNTTDVHCDMSNWEYSFPKLDNDMFYLIMDKDLIKEKDTLVFQNMLNIKQKNDTLYSLKLKLFFHKLSYKENNTWVLYNVEANEDFLNPKGFTHACYKVNYDISDGIISNLRVDIQYDQKKKGILNPGIIIMQLLYMKIVNDELEVLDITKDLMKNTETPFEINYTEILKCKK